MSKKRVTPYKIRQWWKNLPQHDWHGRFFGYEPEYGRIYLTYDSARSKVLRSFLKMEDVEVSEPREDNWIMLRASDKQLIAFAYCMFHEEEMDEVTAAQVRGIACEMKRMSDSAETVPRMRISGGDRCVSQYSNNTSVRAFFLAAKNNGFLKAWPMR